MAYSDIDASIDAKVVTLLGGSYSIQYDNQEAFVKPDNSVYLRAFIRQAPSTPVAFGDGEFQVIGILGEDKTAINAAVDAIIANFAYLKYNVGDPEGSVVRFQNPQPTPVGRINGRYQVNVAIPFWADLST